MNANKIKNSEKNELFCAATSQPARVEEQAEEPDWANNILYGDGRFKLVVGLTRTLTDPP